MRVQPLAGRLLNQADHDAKSAEVAVISDALWTRRFGADPAIAASRSASPAGSSRSLA